MNAYADDGLDAGRIRQVDVDGISTRVYEAGEGEPLILIHGSDFGSAYSLDSWSLNLPGLAERFRVVAFDKLGQGYTDNPRSDADYCVDALEAHAVSLLRQLDLGPAHLAGHSMGGFLAARIALDHPELVRTLVIVDSNTTAPDDPRYPWTKFYVDLRERVPPGPPSRESVRIEPEAQSWSTAHVTDDFLDRMTAIATSPKLQEAKAVKERVREEVWMASLLPARKRTVEEIEERGLPVPTLVVWGLDDPSAPWPLAMSLFEKIAPRTAQAELHFLARAGHYCFREHPLEFDRLLAAFCLG